MTNEAGGTDRSRRSPPRRRAQQGEAQQGEAQQGEAQPSQRGQGQRRPGRWRSGAESRERILTAARSTFARYGYDRATIRQIAAEARVDPAMVHYFFSTKSKLFATAMELPANPADRVAALLEGGLDELGPRIIRHFLQVWDDAGSFEPMYALLRSAPTDDQSAGLLREFVQGEILGQVARVIGTDDAPLRAELVGSQLMGIALARYVVRIEPLASASPDTVVAWLGPTLQRYLTDPTPPPEPLA
ncbi:TetR family transcriptional regulator [Actinopolymorpha sp. B17G11]|uniref:TetR/AcrR family transcriptional regulator n=1 Tax=unclassified Actinopolymorpha TaxID=2627063 RepID=UPI0032D917FC